MVNNTIRNNYCCNCSTTNSDQCQPSLELCRITIHPDRSLASGDLSGQLLDKSCPLHSYNLLDNCTIGVSASPYSSRHTTQWQALVKVLDPMQPYYSTL